MASTSAVASNNKTFLKLLQENSDDLMVSKRGQTLPSLVTLIQVIMKHKMDLMLITQVTPLHQKVVYSFKFFDDVLTTSRLSRKGSEDACRTCNWHRVAANNLSMHLDDLWDRIKGQVGQAT